MSGKLLNSDQYNIVHVLEHTNVPTRPATVTYSVDNLAGNMTGTQVVDTCRNAFATYIMPGLDTGVTLVSTEAYRGPSPSVLKYVNTSTQAGGRNMASPSSNVALLVHKRTLLLGRKNRGRMYLPWSISEANVDEIGGLNSTELNAWATRLNNFLDEFTPADFVMIISHADETNTVQPAVIDLVADPIVGTQRRRVRS